MERRARSHAHWLLLVPGVGFIAVLLAAALTMTAMQSIGFFNYFGQSQIGLHEWERAFNQQFLDSFLYSTCIGVVSSFGALLLAFPLALYLRRGFFGQAFFVALMRVPLFMPALVAAFLILNLVAYHGIVNEVLVGLGIIEKPLRMLHDDWGIGVVAIQIWKNFPFQLLILMAVVLGIPRELEEAARDLGAGYLGAVRHVLLPLSVPGMLTAVILVFIGVFGDYAINVVAGPHYPQSLALRMYVHAYSLGEWGQAACVAVVLIVGSLLFVWFYTRLASLIGGTMR